MTPTDVLYIRRNFATAISHYVDPVSYDFINDFVKMPLLVGLLMYLLATGADGQTCYTWYRWMLSNQCCQGTGRMKKQHKAAQMLQ